MTPFVRLAALALPFVVAAPAGAVLPPPAGASSASPTKKPAPVAVPAPSKAPTTNHAAPKLPPPAPSDENDEPIIVPPGQDAPLGDEPIQVPTTPPTLPPTPRPTQKPTALPPAKPTAKPTAKPASNPTAKPAVKPTPRAVTRPTPKPTRVTTPTPRPVKANPNAPAGYPYLLSAYSTVYDASLRGRTQNLRMAARNVNGKVVPANGVFSANQAIGRRDAAQGWKEAKMFVNGQVVDGTGAGICQCSTTVYNAALLAGMPIVERYPHTFRVKYAPASRDAAIAWGQKDFKFRNTSGGALYVRTFLRSGSFHTELWGTAPRTVKASVESKIVSRKDGTRSEAYRVVSLADGTTRRERLSRDFYRPHP